MSDVLEPIGKAAVKLWDKINWKSDLGGDPDGGNKRDGVGIKKVWSDVLEPIGKAAVKLWDKINWKSDLGGVSRRR